MSVETGTKARAERPIANNTRHLEGVRVLDLTHVLAGPYCTMLMASHGAEVIKVEMPDVGDLSRRLLVNSEDGRAVAHVSAFLQRGKKAVTINLRSPEGKEVFADLVRKSDVVIENFTPRTMRRLGLDYEALKKINPKLVYTSISGYGHEDIYAGPYTDRPAFNLIAQAMGGLMDITGEAGGPPVPSGIALGDLVASTFALSGTLMALRHAQLTGEGEHVDISMYDCLASFMQRPILRYALTGDMPTRGNDMRENPLGVFEAKDGYVVMTTMGDVMWKRLCALLGRPELADDPRLVPDPRRGAAYEGTIRPILEEWAADRTTHEVVEIFTNADLPAARVQDTADLLNCEHLRARRMVYDFEDPREGSLVMTGTPLKFSGSPDPVPHAAPPLGGDTDSVLRDLLGLSAIRIEQLRAANAI